MKFKSFILIALIGFLIGIGGMALITKPIPQPPPNEMRAEVIKRIDRLAGFDIRAINGYDSGSDTYDIYEPQAPHKFSSDKYKALFKKGNLYQYVLFDTVGNLGRQKEVIPGTTVIDGTIILLDNNRENFLTGPKGVVLTAAEQDYFIRLLYKDFGHQMVREDAQRLNQAKDFALAIYFNGLDDIEDYHNQQKLNAEIIQDNSQ